MTTTGMTMPPSHGRYEFVPITRRPWYRWPNGAGLAVYVALGIEEYMFGAGLTEDILPGASHPDMVNTSWRDYGNRVGAFRLLERMAGLGIRPGILLNTAVYEQHADLMAAARRAGAEIVAHGHTNSDTLSVMQPSQEAAYIRGVAERIAAREGVAPLGWSSPWLAHSAITLDLLAEQGFTYLLDLRLDDQPVWLRTRNGRLLALPYALELNDSTTVIGRQIDARTFADMIVDEFDEMLEASRQLPLVMSIVVHSFISGQPFRLRALTRALRHIVAAGAEVWLATPGEIAGFITDRPELAV